MPLVDRDRELAELRDALDSAHAGEPVTVVVTGDAGVGKSQLVTEFATGARVLTGACLDIDLPFAPFTSVLRELGAVAIHELLPDVAELARLLPTLGEPPARAPELARARLFEQYLALLAALPRPAVLAVEDLHWADRSTRDLLTFLVGNQRAAPGLMIIVTSRSDSLADLARVDWVRRLDLGPLSRRGVRAQLRTLLGMEPAADLVADIYQRSEGNPLFVQALLRCRDQPGVPKSIRDLLLAPMARLPALSHNVARSAAPCGVAIGHELLATVTGLDDATLSAALRPVIAANLMAVAGDGYVFRHALIREVVHDDLLPAERAALHIRYAEALERDPSLAPPGRANAQLAGHWGAVAGRYPMKALHAAWRAADDAAKFLAYAEQLHMLNEVLRLRETHGLEVAQDEVVAAALDAATLAGDVTRALALVETLLAKESEPAVTGELLMRRGELRHALGQPGGIDDLRAAARLIPDDHPAVTTALSALAHRLLTAPFEDEGRAVAEAAIAAARRFGDVRTELMATADMAFSHARAGGIDAQLPVLARARAMAERRGDDTALLHVLRREADVLQGDGRYAEAMEVARRGLAVCAAAGLARTEGPVHAANLAESLIAVGRWDEAAETIDQALGHPPIPGFDAYLLVLRGTIQLARGDLAGARTATTYASEVFARGYPDTQDLLPLARLEIDLRLADGADASAVVTNVLALPDVTASPRYLWPVLASAARVTESLPKLRALASTLPVIGPVQRAHRLTFAAIAEPEAQAWGRAAAAWAALGEPYPHAQSLLAKGTELAAAAALADRLGAIPLRTEIERLATVLRVPLTETRDDRHGLTERELEVLRLLAAGHTNRQIAVELFISAKTVSTHVSNILTKLAVPGRVQAATAAHRRGLV